jgi:CRP-like cAMP-binding protein
LATQKTSGEPLRLDEIIARLPYFAGVPAGAAAEAARFARLRRFASGEPVLIEGAPCEGLYFVVRGQVRLIRSSADGRSQVLGVLGPGATFNEIAVFDGGPNPYSAVAVGGTAAGFLPKAKMLALLERYPEIARAALRVASSRQRQLVAVAGDLALRDVTARVARLLLGCIGRHEHMIEGAESACARITQQEIASMVGSVREVVQRALKQLEREGAISLARTRISVLDVDSLERWSKGT